MAFRLKLTPLDERDLTVGAGLLANAFCQSIYSYLTHRVRQQAGSYGEIALTQWDRLQPGRGQLKRRHFR